MLEEVYEIAAHFKSHNESFVLWMVSPLTTEL